MGARGVFLRCQFDCAALGMEKSVGVDSYGSTLAGEVSYGPGDSSSRVHVLLADLSLEADDRGSFSGHSGAHIRGSSHLKFLQFFAYPRYRSLMISRGVQGIEPTVSFIPHFFPQFFIFHKESAR